MYGRVVERVVAGVHYPRSLGELQAWFRSDGACLDYLAWLRWPRGFHCVACGSVDAAWALGDGRWMCSRCGYRRSVTAGTIFHRTRTPLSVWFAAAWRFATSPTGVSAVTLQRELELGSYQTAWTMLQRLRTSTSQTRRRRLRGVVEVDETFIGGFEPGRDGRARGAKVLTGIAVEVFAPRGLGRCRLTVLPDASRASLERFVQQTIEPGSTVRTDGWRGYLHVAKLGYEHEVVNQSALRRELQDSFDPTHVLAGTHRVASLVKRWLLGTHQGAVSEEHIERYFDEFTFRFNRRHAKQKGFLFYRLLQLAVRREPITNRDLVMNPRPGHATNAPPSSRSRPPSLDRNVAGHPWRGEAPPDSD